MTAPAHTHSGPEAWYTVAGETCLETPDGVQIGRAGGPPVIVGWATDASDCNWHRDTPRSGSDPARREQTSYDFGPRLEAQGTLQQVRRSTSSRPRRPQGSHSIDRVGTRKSDSAWAWSLKRAFSLALRLLEANGPQDHAKNDDEEAEPECVDDQLLEPLRSQSIPPPDRQW